MTLFPSPFDRHDPDRATQFSVQFHLLGSVDYDECLALQRRLVYEAGGQTDGRIAVLICEHTPFISIGRRGSRGHIHLTNEQLRSRHLRVRWIGRGGGCILHAPGQIAVYPIVPLAWHGWSAGEYLRRFREALLRTLNEFRIQAETTETSFGIWGRTGLIAAMGAAIHGDISCHGAFVNVNPMMTHFPFVHVLDPLTSPPGRKTTMGCLLAERRQAVTIPKVRAALVPHLAASFGTEQYHLLTGHPWLPNFAHSRRPSKHRAS